MQQPSTFENKIIMSIIKPANIVNKNYNNQ